MREVTLFIAMSLDGYIADENGGVDWLEGDGTAGPVFDPYPDFVRNIATILIGWNTYHQIVSELSPDYWVYEEQETIVFTHREQPSSNKIRFTKEDPVTYLKELKKTKGKGIWICGGASLISQLRNADLIDCYDITIIPVLLGSGIRLFEQRNQTEKLRLEKVQHGQGMVNLVYTRRNEAGRSELPKKQETAGCKSS